MNMQSNYNAIKDVFTTLTLNYDELKELNALVQQARSQRGFSSANENMTSVVNGVAKAYADATEAFRDF